MWVDEHEDEEEFWDDDPNYSPQPWDWDDDDWDWDSWGDPDFTEEIDLTDEQTTNQQKGNTMNDLPKSRTHRTALVINTSEGVDSRFKERYERLLQSVGGTSIKVDVFTQTKADVDVAAWAKGILEQFPLLGFA